MAVWVALLASGCVSLGGVPVAALETNPAAENLANSQFSLEDEQGKEHPKERKEVEKLLSEIEEQWNAHNLEKVMSYYSDDYINNDGLDKKAVAALTQDFWKTYPDAKSVSKTKQIRIEGNFATVESRDMAVGSTAKPMPGIGTKGDLRSISEGQLYIKKFGNVWKITGDRIDFEKVRVAFGMAKELNAQFSAPEQVKSGHQYSAKLEVDLPPGLTAVGSITSQALKYPQPTPPDTWRQIDGPSLERVLPANTSNHNELLMATIGITNSQRNTLMGIEFLTRRLNVVPTLVSDSEGKKDDDKMASQKAGDKNEAVLHTHMKMMKDKNEKSKEPAHTPHRIEILRIIPENEQLPQLPPGKEPGKDSTASPNEPKKQLIQKQSQPDTPEKRQEGDAVSPKLDEKSGPDQSDEQEKKKDTAGGEGEKQTDTESDGKKDASPSQRLKKDGGSQTEDKSQPAPTKEQEKNDADN